MYKKKQQEKSSKHTEGQGSKVLGKSFTIGVYTLY